MQRRQQIDHVVGHGARDVSLVIAEGRGFGCNQIFQQMNRRKRPPVVGGMIAKGSFDLELGTDLRKEAALHARRAVEAANHARYDARQRLGEDRNR